MTQPSYKHAISVTGQVFFCSAPLRLDPYDACEFGCVYCFSRKRSRLWSQRGIHYANAEAFRDRIERIRNGQVNSAVDEMLSARVPLQLGGLQDPFTPRERNAKVTYRLLQTLRDAEYPTLISTKGSLIGLKAYRSLVAEMNVVVRFSAAGVREDARCGIEPGCQPFRNTLERISTLSQLGVPTALRIQPVIPGFEEDALRMAEQAATAGVKQIVFEYLKIPGETVRSLSRTLLEKTGVNVIENMRNAGLQQIGWDYVLPSEIKRPFIGLAKATCRRLGVAFGAGDTEFIPWSDGDGCCGSSALFLKGAKQFQANFVGVIKSSLTNSGKVSIDMLERKWHPTQPISTYLSSKSRRGRDEGNDWFGLLATRWNGDSGPYSPGYFYGVDWHGKYDKNGYRVYDASRLAEVLRRS